ncbi:pseudouridine synthase [Ichthyenterobacterium magnum]|uniref:Pseudouridine synthase n=1 Tax=Ichthyenterobacterium magnum TaxID=1230530 RepID=A0A420DMC5_9FLAO|nr:pseudouridine synthase [Ichthyenterobacterium magnum]RKE95393.1 23S rRNA pseudouridine2457 synthase [Ichthyenterobacterium magnum]
MNPSKTIHQHFKLYKPYGYLSQFKSNAKHELKKKFLGELYNFPKNTMAIGRLDKDSEGLLLLTTNGKVSYAICNTSVEKEYYVQVDGEITKDAINQLQGGVVLSYGKTKYTTKPSKVHKLTTIPDFPKRGQKIRDDRHGATSWVSITINEGKFRQVRKMTAVVGFPTLRLVRVRVGTITLDGLNSGNVIEVNNLI